MDYSVGGLSDFPKTKKIAGEEKAAIKKRAEGLLKKLEESAGKPLEELDKAYLVRLIRGLVVMLCQERTVLRTATKYLTAISSLIEERHIVDSKRTEKRDDRVDKQRFQEAVRVNIEEYNTVQDAVDDLISKPDFAKYEEETLWKWARKVWPKPTKSGRPAKK